MSKKKNDNGFDSVAFKREAQSKIYKETKDMTAREQVAYFRKRAQTGSIGQWWKQLSPTSLDIGSRRNPARVAESRAAYGRKKK